MRTANSQEDQSGFATDARSATSRFVRTLSQEKCRTKALINRPTKLNRMNLQLKQFAKISPGRENRWLIMTFELR